MCVCVCVRAEHILRKTTKIRGLAFYSSSLVPKRSNATN